MSNPFKEILESNDISKLWDELTFFEREQLLQKLQQSEILTEPELMAAITYSRLGELSRMSAVMDIITEFVINRIANEPPEIGPDGLKIGF